MGVSDDVAKSLHNRISIVRFGRYFPISAMDKTYEDYGISTQADLIQIVELVARDCYRSVEEERLLLMPAFKDATVGDLAHFISELGRK